MSSATIVPPDFTCCGPFGAARYYKVSISGISGTCPQCTLNCSCAGLNGDYYFDLLRDTTGTCQSTLSLSPSCCGYGLLTFGIELCPGAPERVAFFLSLVGTALSPPGTSLVWRKDNVQNCLETQKLPFFSQVGTECSASGSVTVEPVPPQSMKAIFDTCFHCPNCDKAAANLPQVWAPQDAGFAPTCCPRCDAMRRWAERNASAHSMVPAPGSAGGNCSGGGCRVQYNAEHGNVMVQFAPPEGDAWSPIPEFTLNTTYSLFASLDFFGKRISSIFNQVVVEGNPLMPESKIVIKCDGSQEVHTCKPPGPGQYLPPPNSPNRLFLNADDTYTERCGDGFIFDYDTDGLLNQITNPSGKIWTLVNGSPVKYIIDPASRRTTLSYDSVSGKLRRFQDPFGRLTTFTLDSGNRLTKFITPELCTTEFRYYDADDRLKALISPEGLRTSFAYTGDGLCSEIKEPSGALYSYEYESWSKTRVTAPNSAVTTLTHGVSRQILSVTEPSGIRTSFTYQGRRLQSTQLPTGARTTYVYSTLANDTVGLTKVLEPQGCSTFTYDSNSRLKATSDPLGNRTSLVLNGSGLQIAEINALNQRTSFVYSTNGQRAAEINALGNRTSYVYNSTGNRIAQINPLGNRTTYGYTNGQLTKIKTAIGAITTFVYDGNNRKKAEVDPLGNRTSFLYESCSLPKATIRPSGARTTNVYSFGRLSATIDPLGNRTSFAYDSLGRQIRAASPMGRISTIIYDSDGQLTATINPSALRTTTLYDSAGRSKARIEPTGVRTSTIYSTASTQPIAEIAPDGTRTSYTYNANNQLVRMQSSTGAINTTVYDKLSRQIATIDPFSKRTTTVYDTGGRRAAIIDALGNRSTLLYDSADRNTATISPLGRRNSFVYDVASRRVATLDGRDNRWTSVYDLASRQVASVDPLLRRTTSIYDSSGRQKAAVRADATRTTSIYDAADQMVATISSRGFRTTVSYNPDGQRRYAENALGYRTTSVYDSGGRGKAVINARGNRTTTIYDAFGRVSASQNALNKRWTTVFDSVGRSKASVDPLGSRVTTIYDSAGRVKASINPLGKRTTTVYDLADRVTSQIDANSHRTTTVYDALGRQQASVTALGFRTTSVFDADGRKISLVDPRGNRQSFTYDAASAQTQQIDALDRRTTCAYDAAGQQTVRLDARGFRTSFSYSLTGQLTARKYPDGTRSTSAYDADGSRTLMADASGRVTTLYDAVNRVSGAKLPNSKRLTYSYDAVGNRRLLDAPDAGRFTYTYDAVDQLASLLNPYAERTSFSYDDAGRRTLRRNANGTRTSIAYDAASQITQQHSRTSAGAAIANFDYKYDNAGNRTGALEHSGARVTWAYDGDNRLTAERRSGASSYAQTFAYDAAGNRTLKNADTVRTTYSYDVANQLRYGLASAGRTTYMNDAAGNQQVEQPPAGARTTTAWDYENRPTLYKLPSGTRVTMSYNSDGRRTMKASAIDIVNFVWDPITDTYLGEFDDSDSLQAVYTQEPVEYGGLISQRRGSVSHFYHDDALGSSRALTDSSQLTTDTYLYDAWGNHIASSSNTTNPFRWVGKVGYYYDHETQCVYVRARIYQPTIGRWVSIDPFFSHFVRSTRLFIQGTIRYPASDNLYLSSESIQLIDPSGQIVIGTARCRVPSGVVYDKRGYFDIYRLADYDNSEDYFTRIGSSMFLKWKWNRAEFLRVHTSCCCCDEVGFVQAVIATSSYGKILENHTSRTWVVDGTIPYAHSSTASPCKSSNAIRMSDMPNAPGFERGFGRRLKSLKQDFETCVVCLKGMEGYKWSYKLEYGDLPGNWRVNGIVVYGCIKWGHYIYWSKEESKYVYTRYVEGHKAQGESGVQVTGTFGGAPPSQHWKEAVLARQ